MPPLVAEELVVLAYHPDGIAHGRGVELDCALAGALLLELAISGVLEVVDERLRLVGAGVPKPTHPELIATLHRIAEQPARSPQWWVQRLARGLRRRLLDGLVGEGVLTDETYRSLGVFTRHRFPESDPQPRENALRRLRALLADARSSDARSSDARPPDPRTAALASMVNAARLAPKIFSDRDRDGDRRAVDQRLTGVADGDWATVAVRKAVEAVYAATVAAAVSGGAVAATTGG